MCSKVCFTATGFTLVEVLFVAFILSFGVLGFLQSELMALRMTQKIQRLSVAQITSYRLAESIKATDQTIPAGLIEARWRTKLQAQLPRAQLRVNVVGQNYQVEITGFSARKTGSAVLYTLYFSV